jgi:hypothetical protein
MAEEEEDSEAAVDAGDKRHENQGEKEELCIGSVYSCWRPRACFR